MVKFIKKGYKRVISLLLAMVTILSLRGVTAYADSNDRVATFINLASGESIQDNLADVQNLTQDELRFLGIYISNFFIPFGTELGSAGSEDETTTQNQEDIKAALQNNLDFSDEVADLMTETILGLSRSNNQELTFKVSEDYHTGYVDVPNFRLNYWNFLRLMLGQTKAVFEGYVENNDELEEGDVLYDLADESTCDYKYGYFGYEGENGFTPMFDCSLYNQMGTPSMYAFYQCLGSVDISQGYGFSFFDFNRSEVSEGDDINAIFSGASEDQIYRMSAYGSSIVVDCFGNLILKGGNHQHIMVPACMNPYTWVSVKDDGSDMYQAGTAYNVISFNAMSLADVNKLMAAGSSVSYKSDEYEKEEGENLKWMALKKAPLQDQLDELEEPAGHWNDAYGGVFNSVRNTVAYTMRLIRGSDDYDMGTFLGLGTSAYKEAAQAVQDSFISANPGDYSYYYSIGNGVDPAWYSTAFQASNQIGLFDKFTMANADRKEVRIVDGFVYLDNLGAYEGSEDYSLINFGSYLDDSGASPNQLLGEYASEANNGFTSMYQDIQSGKMNTEINISSSAAASVYTTYAIAGLYKDDTSSKQATIGKLGFRINKEGLPTIENDPIDIPDNIQSSVILTSIRDWLYYLLHPTDGLNYVRELITNKLNALLVGWHNDMVGTNGVGVTTGTTLYRSQTGYVTTPDLSEIQWTNSLIELYNNAIPFLIVMMLVMMLFAYITGILTIQRSIFGVVIFTIFLFMPVNLINGVVGTSNRISQNLYGEKFTYWALVQQQTYSEAIESASSGDSYQNYLRTLYATNNMIYSNQGSESIVLKWQAPKKMASLMLSENDQDTLSGLQDSNLLGLVMNNNAFSGESYLDDEDAVYMYRSYLDISNFSKYIYNSLDTGKKPTRTSLANNITTNVNDSLKQAINEMYTNYELDRNNGYTNVNGDGSSNVSGTLRITVPMSSLIYNDALADKGTIKDLELGNFVGVNSDAFNFSLAMFNNSNMDYNDIVTNTGTDNSSTQSVRQDAIQEFLNNYSDEDISGLAAYSIYSENVFYYFSWALYDMGMSTSSNASDGYRNLLLGSDNGGFFYNTKGNGELKDFMDMKSLFTYIIPYLRMGNDIVREWDNTYGLFTYDGVPTEEGYWDDPEIQNNPEMKQQYWHNLNVSRLYSIYCPWVDIMYDCSYAQAETITVMGEKYVVEDPLDPASYPDERPMIFSESEMQDYGLGEGDLTKVERLILECNQGMEERMYELLNYYNFNDTTLNTAAAMNCAFEFNSTFSENGVFNSNHNIYPQSFELADFSYDAFLRFILANNTGEELDSSGTNVDLSDGNQSDQDFYFRLVNNSSTTTAIVMVILDILSVYLLPAFKIFFIIGAFLASIFIILSTARRVDPEQKFIKKVLSGVVLPMLYFFLITIGFSYVISLFMGVGNNAVTQSEVVSIQMGDPVIVMFAMIAIDIGVLYLYFKVIKTIVRTIKTEGSAVLNFAGAVFGGVAAMIGGTITSGFRGSSSSVGAGGGAGAPGYRSGEGTGVESPRAERRASGGNKAMPEDYDDRYTEQSDMRRNESKRRTINPDDNKKMSNEDYKRRKEDINAKTQEGTARMNRSDRFSSDDKRVKDSGNQGKRRRD